MSLSEKIIFDGRELARHVPGIHVIDISIGSISREHNSQARTQRAGSMFASKRDSTRSITIQVELPLNKEEAALNYNLLQAWADSDQPAPLYLPNRVNSYINVVISDITELNIKTWYEPISLEFVAYDPYFFGVQCQESVGQRFRVAGDVETDFIIKSNNELAITDPKWLIDGKQFIGFTGSIGAGLLMIDTKRSIATLNGDSIMPKLNYDSRFYPLSPGYHTISGPSGTVTWTERWR